MLALDWHNMIAYYAYYHTGILDGGLSGYHTLPLILYSASNQPCAGSYYLL